MVKEVRFGCDDEFRAPRLDDCHHWDTDTDPLLNDWELGKAGPRPRVRRRRSPRQANNQTGSTQPQ